MAAKGSIGRTRRRRILELEIPIPDEPGLVDGRLELLERTSITRDEWEACRLEASINPIVN
jgi:hypothetical protein